jgi:hypothetical protein
VLDHHGRRVRRLAVAHFPLVTRRRIDPLLVAAGCPSPPPGVVVASVF